MTSFNTHFRSDMNNFLHSGIKYLSLFILSFFLLEFSYDNAYAQLSITASGTPFTIDFDATVTGVNNGQFAGSGFQTSPTSGQLNSNAFSVIGLSDGDLSFGGTGTTGDYARGQSNGGVTTGGIYAFQVDSADYSLGFQASDSSLTPGDIILKITNNSGVLASSIKIEYRIWELNNSTGDRSTSLNFSYSPDDTTYTQVSSLDFSTGGNADFVPVWKSPSSTHSKNNIIDLTGSEISNGSDFYLKFSTDDFSGTNGDRDELSIDDINITLNPQKDNDSDATVWAVYQEPSGTISSLADSVSNPRIVFYFQISDIGTSDGVPTNVETIRFVPNTLNESWISQIQGIVISDSVADYTQQSLVITDSLIDVTFSEGVLSVADGTDLPLRLEIFLNLTGIVDGGNLDFKINSSAHGFTSYGSGSSFATTFPADILSNQFTIDVQASELRFIQQPIDANSNIPMAVDVSVEATDINGNRDLDYVTSVDLASSGTLTGDTISVAAVSGLATWLQSTDPITHSVGGTGLTLTASATDITSPSGDAVSDPFDISQGADRLEFTSQPTTGQLNNPVGTITISALRPDLTLDSSFVDNITISVNSGPGTIAGTLTKAAVNGVATFNDISFDTQGGYTLLASSAPYMTTAISGTIQIGAFFEDFSSCPPAGWLSILISGDQFWQCDDVNGYASASGLGGSSASEMWYITPLYDFNVNTNEKLSFDTWTSGTDNVHPKLTVKYSKDYAGSGNPNIATWTELTFNQSNENSQVWTTSGLIDMSAITDSAYIAFKYNSSGTVAGQATEWRIDNVLISDEVCSAPSVQASNLSFPEALENQMTLNWDNGNGIGRMVIARADSAVTEIPIDGTNYLADSVYGAGSPIDSSFVIYKGSGSSMTVTGLIQNTEYFYSVFEYNCNDTIPTFNTASPASGSQFTINPLASDIVATSTYVYNTDIDYTPYIALSGLAVGTTIDMFGLTLRDEGKINIANSDGNPTELTSISLSTNGSTSIRAAGIFKTDGTRIAEKLVNGATSFVLDSFENTLIALSDDSIDFVLRVTFEDQVLDNEQIVFTVTGATANDSTSLILQPDAGGAESINTGGPENKIIVTATILNIVQAPTYSLPINVDFTIEVEAVDTVGKRSSRDLDKSLTVSVIQGTGSLTSTSGLTKPTSDSTALWTDLIYNTAESPVQFAISDGGLLADTTTVYIAKEGMAIFTFTGSSGDETTLPPDFQPVNISVSDISRGPNIVASPLADAFSARSWPQTGFNDSSYYEITLTANAGFTFDINSIEFDHRRSATGPKRWEIRNSTDNFNGSTAGNIDSVKFWNRNTDISLTITNEDTVTFRIYAYQNVTSALGTWAVDNIEFYGIVKDIKPPAFNAGFPKYDSVSVSGFDLQVNIDEAAFAYYVVQNPTTPAPDESQIKTGLDGNGAVADASGLIDVTDADSTFIDRITSLGSLPLYDVYFVLDDGTFTSPIDTLVDVPISDTDTDLTSATQPGGSTIPSISDNPADSVAVFSFNISDIGTNDSSSTHVTKLVFNAGTNNIADWSATIGGIRLYNDTKSINIPISNTTIGTNSLVVDINQGDLSVDDGMVEQITLSIWLTNTITDNENLQFTIGGNPHGNITSTFGSQFKSSTTVLNSNTFTIDVAADRLHFFSYPAYPTALQVGVNFTVEVEAIDALGNRDTDNDSTIVSLTRGLGTGIITYDTSLVMTNGLVTWTDVQYDTGTEFFTIIASDNGTILLSDTTSTLRTDPGADLLVQTGNTLTISGNQSFNKVTVEDGGTLNLAQGAILNIADTFSINGPNGVYNDLGGTTIFASSSEQFIRSDEAGKTVSFYNITINNGVDRGVVNEININLINTLKLNSGSKFDADGTSDANNFTLVSTSTATARIATVENGAALSGDIVWQRSLRSGPEGWRYVGTPIKGQTVANWRDDVHIQGIDENFPNRDPNFGYYHEPSGTQGPSGFDGWVNYTKDADPVPVGVGNKLWEWDFLYDPTLTIINKGLPTIGDGADSTIIGTEVINFPVSFTPTSFDGGGWNFFANPYPCELDWDSPDFVHTNVEGGAVYIWNPATQQYGTYGGGESINGVTQYVASGQGFYIKAVNGSATVSVNENAKATVDGNSFLRVGDEPYASLKIKITSGDSRTDETVVAFKSHTTDGYDIEYDARKFAGGWVNLSTKLDNNLLMAINSMGALGGIKKVQLNIQSYIAGGFSFTFPKFSNFDTETVIMLRDNYLDQTRIVTPTMKYDFSIDANIPETSGDQRFELQILSPVKFWFEELQAKSGQEFVMPVYADQISDIINTVMGLGWDAEALTFIGIEDVGVMDMSDFDLSDIENGILKLNATEETPLELPGESILFSIRFKANSGQAQAQLRFERSSMKLKAIGDIDMPFSTVDIIIDILQNRLITGRIATYTGINIDGVDIKLQGDEALENITDITGEYSFDAFEQSQYTIAASKTDDQKLNEAVTTLDIIKTRRHILQVEPLTSPYQVVAADVNISKSVTALDLAQMRRVVLGFDEGFSGGLNWLFIPETYDLSENPFNFESSVDLDVTDAGIDLNFIGVKIGDVNDSWTNQSDTRTSKGKLELSLEHLKLTTENIIEIPITVSDFKDISGYQFSISWNANQLEYYDVEHVVLEGYFNDENASNGILSTMWDDADGKSIDLDDGKVLFILKFNVVDENISGLVEINSSLTNAVAVDGKLNLMKINATSANVNIDELRNGKLELYQNIPNPFDFTTEIGFRIVKAGKAQLTIINLLGEIVYLHEDDYEPGVYSVNWEISNSLSNIKSGMYLYRLESNGQEVVKKMLIE